MEIERTPNEKVRFEDIDEGHTFSDGTGDIFMKMDIISDEQELANAVNIDDGSHELFGDNLIVELVFGKFVID